MSKITKKIYQAKAVLLVLNFLDSDYTSMRNFGKWKLKYNCFLFNTITVIPLFSRFHKRT